MENLIQKIESIIPANHHKLQKMTRLLINEQQKSVNRIKLFHRTTTKMICNKKKEFEIKKSVQKNNAIKSYSKTPQYLIEPITNKNTHIRNLKSECSLRTRKTLKSICSSRANEINNLAESRRLSKKQNECNDGNKIELIASSKQKELRRNLKSAKLIRESRDNVKSAKQKYFNWKIEGVKQLNKQRWHKNYNEYIQRFQRLQNLKRMEFEALVEWKRNKQLLQGNADDFQTPSLKLSKQDLNECFVT